METFNWEHSVSSLEEFNRNIVRLEHVVNDYTLCSELFRRFLKDHPEFPHEDIHEFTDPRVENLRKDPLGVLTCLDTTGLIKFFTIVKEIYDEN